MYAKNKMPLEAKALLNEMKEQGILPNQFTYTSLIQLHASLEQIDEAVTLFNEMKQQEESKPDRFTYATMMNMFVKYNQPKQALAFYSEMNPRPSWVSAAPDRAGTIFNFLMAQEALSRQVS